MARVGVEVGDGDALPCEPRVEVEVRRAQRVQLDLSQQLLLGDVIQVQHTVATLVADDGQTHEAARFVGTECAVHVNVGVVSSVENPAWVGVTFATGGFVVPLSIFSLLSKLIS